VTRFRIFEQSPQSAEVTMCVVSDVICHYSKILSPFLVSLCPEVSFVVTRIQILWGFSSVAHTS
jgi:hypothetical protein